MRAQKHLRGILSVATAALVLAGCSLEVPSNVTDRQLELRSGEHAFKMPVSDLNDQKFEEIGRHYWRYGTGPARVAVTYMPASKTDTAMTASLELARVTDGLRKRGIQDIRGDILPIEGSPSTVLVTYTSVNVAEPAGCPDMPGAEGKAAEIDVIEGYEMGCGVKSQIARQISRPKDLRGQGGNTPSDSARASNVIEGYRVGPAE